MDYSIGQPITSKSIFHASCRQTMLKSLFPGISEGLNYQHWMLSEGVYRIRIIKNIAPVHTVKCAVCSDKLWWNEGKGGAGLRRDFSRKYADDKNTEVKRAFYLKDRNLKEAAIVTKQKKIKGLEGAVNCSE